MLCCVRVKTQDDETCSRKKKHFSHSINNIEMLSGRNVSLPTAKKCKYDSTPLLVLRNGNPVEIFINLTSHLKLTLSGYSREIYCYSFCLRVDEVLQNNTTVRRHDDEDVSDGRLVACSAARLSSLLLFSCCSAGPGGPMQFPLRPLCLLHGCSSNSRPAWFLRRPAATDVCSSGRVQR